MTTPRSLTLSKMKPNRLAVIGGGPIGLYTAIILARKGYQIDLFEKGTWPRDKVCGQSIMPSGINILKEIGINFDGLKDSYFFKGIQYIDQDFDICGQLPKDGIGLERKVLSQKLYQVASEDPNIDLFANTIIQDAQIHSHNAHIMGTFLGDNQQFEKKYLYAFICDGLNSHLRSILDNQKKRTEPLRMGARLHCDIPPWSKNVQVYWSDGIEAYITPVSMSRVEIAFLWYTDKFTPKSHLCRHLLDIFPTIKEKITKKQMNSDFRAYGPFSTLSYKMKVGHYYFVGDAYQFIDGITGEGISLGLKSANTIVNNFEHFTVKNELQIKTLYFKYKVLANLALYLSRHQKLRRTIFFLATKRPSIFNFLIKLNDL